MEGILLNLKTELNGVARSVKLFERAKRRMPIITAIALSKTAKQTKEREEREMAKVFKNPRKYVLNSLFARTANKTNLRATVEDRLFAGKGTPASNFLAPQIKGGSRKKKRSERALEKAGILPPNKYMLPSKQAPAKVRQNKGSEYTKMLSGLGSFQGDKAYMNSELGSKGDDYFVMFDKGKTDPVGIGKRLRGGKGFRMYFVFIKKPHYDKRFKFFEVGIEFARKAIKENFAQAVRDTFKRYKTTLSKR